MEHSTDVSAMCDRLDQHLDTLTLEDAEDVLAGIRDFLLHYGWYEYPVLDHTFCRFSHFFGSTPTLEPGSTVLGIAFEDEGYAVQEVTLEAPVRVTVAANEN